MVGATVILFTKAGLKNNSSVSQKDLKKNNTLCRRDISPYVAVALLTILSLPIIFAQTPQTGKIQPVIPTVNRSEPGKVFLEHADRLYQEEGPGNIAREYQILSGNVTFRKDNMFMYCDSAYFYEKTNSLDAFSNVRMEQGDTLFIYADELNYNGMSEMAVLYANAGKKVRMINRDVTLSTDIFNYDLKRNIGYYQTGGMLTDRQNQLTSLEGYYYPSSKDAYFFDNVILTGKSATDTMRMETDSLKYNTATHEATLIAKTYIESKDGHLVSSSGNYNTVTGMAYLFSRSKIITRKNNVTLEGDTLFYNRDKGYGTAMGNMELVDTAGRRILLGEYGFYNENTDSAFVTGDALAKDYSRGDTLYLHGDTINAYYDIDTTRVTNAFHRVRFFRNDIQGLCDSMSVTERDSTMRMFRKPIVWSGPRQVSGNLINVHFNDSTADLITLPKSGLMAEHIGEDCFNQLSGDQMTIWLNDTTVTRLYVEGSATSLLFPMEQDSTYNKYAQVESSFLNALFVNNEIDSVVVWPQASGIVKPLYLSKRGEYLLPGFRWYEKLRPLAPDEVFDYPDEMDLLLRKDDEE